MKKIITLLICFMLVVALSKWFYIDKNINNDQMIGNDLHYRALDQEEAIKRISEVDNISLKAATRKLLPDENLVIKFFTKILPFTDNTKFYEYYTIKELGKGQKVEVGSICKMYGDFTHNEFREIISSWSEINSVGNHTWKSNHVSNQILNYGQLRLFSEGIITFRSAGDYPRHFEKKVTIDETITLPWWKP